VFAYAHVLVAHRAVHAARREHIVINFARHFHVIIPVSKFLFIKAAQQKIKKLLLREKSVATSATRFVL
jgi:hypothetical protein